MTARLHADNIIQRARDIRSQSEHQDRSLIKAALLDITLDVAITVARRASELCKQQWAYPQKKLRIMRDLRAMWKAIAKNVKAVYDDHPINDRHLYVVLAAYHPQDLRNYEKLFDVYLQPDDSQLLYHARPATARATALRVLAHY